ncbi:MAG: DegT/DnrJ/EryC1/StrS family aminotransferase [Pseudomonadota bacterium]
MREVPFHKPCIEEDELREVADTLKKGWLTMGPKTIEFEEAFRKKIKARYAVSVNSCTAALHLALKVIDLRENDEVIIPSMTFAATGEVVRYFNAHPVIVDVDRETHNILLDEIERHITPKTRAIIPVHFAGQPADMDEINDIALRYKLRVIEDAAHCFPSFYKKRPIGTFSDITAFSFYATKTLATGEGGLAATENENFAEKMKVLRLHGINKDAWKRYTKHGNWYYEVIDVGYKYNMTDIQAALGLAQLRKTERMWQARKHIARHYTEAFKDNDYIITPTIRDYVSTSWHLYVIKLRLENLSITRNQFIAELQKKGVGVSVHFIPLHRHPVYKNMYGLRPHDFNNSEWLYERTISLPIFPDMTIQDIAQVVDAVQALTKKYGKSNDKVICIPLAAPDITDKGRLAVMEVLQTKSLSFGPKLEEFEQAGAAYAERKYGIAVNSGTSGLHLIIKSLGIAEGDRVITSPFSFIASANCMLFERAEPVFVDINKDDLNFSPVLIEEMLKKDKKKKIKAIMAVDIFAHPVDWDALYDIAEKYDVKLIEDSSEALGSSYRSPDSRTRKRWKKFKRAGSFGEASVFVFYTNKQITTGEGGLILTDDMRLYALCRSLRNQGRAEGAGWFSHERLGYNYRLSDINCALGVVQLQRIEEMLKHRAAVAQYYNRRLQSISCIKIPYCAPHVKLGWFVYVIQLGDEFRRKDRDGIIQKLKKRGIESSNYFAPIHLQPFYRKMFGYKPGDFPVTESVAERTLALPFFNNLKEPEIDFVVDNLKDILDKV